MKYCRGMPGRKRTKKHDKSNKTEIRTMYLPSVHKPALRSEARKNELYIRLLSGQMSSLQYSAEYCCRPPSQRQNQAAGEEAGGGLRHIRNKTINVPAIY